MGDGLNVAEEIWGKLWIEWRVVTDSVGYSQSSQTESSL